MRKVFMSIILAAILLPATVCAQTYSVLWKQADNATEKDLPATRMEVLGKIERKAVKEKEYGQLLKAGMEMTSTLAAISPDSLKPAVERIASKEVAAKDPVLRAVYSTVMWRIYTDDAKAGQQSRLVADADIPDGKTSSDVSRMRAEEYRVRAMAEPARLAAARTSVFEPFVVKGTDSRIFNDDMLSVIGFELEDYKTLMDYYAKTGNRRALCVCALFYLKKETPAGGEDIRKSVYINRLDSLLSVFGDLDEAGEVAVERYRYMTSCSGVTAEDRIEYIHYALSRWGAWGRVNELRNAERELTAPQFGYELERRTIAPGKKQMVRLVNLRNLNTLTMNVYRTRLDGSYRGSVYNRNNLKEVRQGAVLLPEMCVTKTFVGNPDYHVFEDSVILGGLPVGVYMIEFVSSPSSEVSRQLYYVTDVFRMTQPLPDNRQRHVVVSSTTGQPIAGAKLCLFTEKRYGTDVVSTTLTCNAEGEVIYKYSDRQPDLIYAYTDKDKACPVEGVWSSFSYYDRDRDGEYASVFTDRRIYRPGQTIRAAAIVYRNTGKTENNAVAGKEVVARLRDANHEIVVEKKLFTDSYGTCSADFVIPQGSLNGNFVVEIGQGAAYVKVEEYKRPTFKVDFPEVNEKYSAGDTLTVRGKATTYSGLPVQGAKVKYKVVRRAALWWVSYYGYAKVSPGHFGRQSEVVFQSEASTADDGSFAVEIPLMIPSEVKNARMFYNFAVEADVTDIGGETHNGILSVPLGTHATVFTSDLPTKVRADSLKSLTFHQRNAAGVDVTADVCFYIDNPDDWHNAKTTVPFALDRRLTPGRHHLYAVCDADTLEMDFTVFGIDDVSPCEQTHDWFYLSSQEFPQDGGAVTLQAGSSDADVHVVYSIISGKNVIESGAFNLNNELQNRKFTYKDIYGDGILLNYAWVKDGVCYSHKATIRRAMPEKKLKMQWITFRDRLKPGQEEEWKLRITRNDGKPVTASVMATMYDKSLDQIAGHSWNFAPVMWNTLPYTAWTSMSLRGLSDMRVQRINMLKVNSLDFSHFDNMYISNTHYLLNGSVNGVYYAKQKKFAAARGVMLSASSQMKEAKMEASVAFDSAADEAVTEDMGTGTEEGNGGYVQLRENLSETAFFYPSLTTDEEGCVAIKFTLPESLTSWRFIGLGHTADMFSGLIDAEAVARKDVMIQPNMPRFVRVGDDVKIMAKVFNTGLTAISGTACMELIDPVSMKTVLTYTDNVYVEAGEASSVEFSYIPDDTAPLLICRMSVTGSGFSDGEQHYLPVLPDKERITVTVPFTQTEPGIEEVDVARLFPKDSENMKLTVEYTNNPAWLVVQALPVLGQPREDNAIDLCASLYSNGIGKWLIDRMPSVKTIFEQWKREQAAALTEGNPDSNPLMSQLEKNSSLKDVVLNETPWLADADKEGEQRRVLADFFDDTAMRDRTLSAVTKLKKLQNADGSWSWWPGMQGSMNMTVGVAEMLVRLNVMTGKQQNTKAMLDDAFRYMDAWIVKEVAEMKAYERKGQHQVFPGETVLRYLYMNALDERYQNANVKSACSYLIGLLKKEIKNQTIYEKALTAIILDKEGSKNLSRDYVKSLKEYTVYQEDMGRYYDTRKAYYSWYDYKIPTQVAAMEAISMITPDDRMTVQQMLIWLLQQKRTQDWNTPVSTVNAVYAFMADNKEVFRPQEQTVLAVDGKPLKISESTAGIGYVKAVVDGYASKDMGSVFTAEKKSAGTSWGAVYAQYLQKTSGVEKSGSGMNVRWEIIGGKNRLKVGDRVNVRITVDAKRDYDFVQVVFRRAACMEPVNQLSGYRNGAYCSAKDNATCYYFDKLSKGRHVIETEYYIDRAGSYETGTCTVSCAYAPEYRATVKSERIEISK